MVIIQSNQRIAIFGKTRSGKTVFARSLLKFYDRCIFHDRKHESIDLIRSHHFKPIYTPAELISALQKGFKRILYLPADPGIEDFDEVCRITYYAMNITLFVDEAQSYASSSTIPFYFSEILRLGAQRNVGCVILSQRPRSMTNFVISEAEIIISFKLQLATDRRKIVEVVGPEVDEPLRTMPPYHFMLYDGDDVHFCAPIPYR